MGATLLFQDLLLVLLLWLGGILYERWARPRSATGPTLHQPAQPTEKHAHEPKPIPGLIHKPCCAACEQAPEPGSPAPRVPPALLSASQGRPRQVDTTQHFCPQPHRA
jgi:hypothetical protein